MDNLAVLITGTLCLATAEMSTSWFESITPLGIVALVVYYFLVKYDKKLEKIDQDTGDIKDAIGRLEESNERYNSRTNDKDN